MTYPTRWQVPALYSMTNDADVFPMLRGQRFFVKKTAKFPPTIIKTAASGRTARFQVASQPTWDFKLSYSVLSNYSPTASDLQVLQSFLLSRNGAAQPFFLYDPEDNVVSNQYIGTGNGTSNTFQLVRTINPAGNNAFIENVYAVLGAPTVLVNGLPLYGPAQQNLLSYSNGIAGTGWGLSNTAIGSPVTAPDGGATGYFVQDTSATGQHSVGQTAPVVANGTYTFSVYLQAGVYNNPRIVVGDVSLANAFKATFTLSGAGSVSAATASGTASLISTSITALSGGWYRATITGTIGAFTTVSANIYLNSGNSYAGTVGNGTYCWGAQLEAGAAATTLNSTHALTGDFTIANNGLIVFNTPPANAAPVYWSGQFLFLCCFGQDNIDAAQIVRSLWSSDGLMVSSIHP